MRLKNKSNTLKISGFLIATCLLLNACSTTCNYTQATLIPGSSEQTMADNNRTNSGYNLIQTLRAQKANDILMGSVIVQSTNAQDRTLRYQFTWFDKNGLQIGEATAWQPFVLYAYSAQQIKAVAPNANAVSYQIHLCTPS